MAEPYARDREERFKRIGEKLIDLYRALVNRIPPQDVPLCIVDEAHNWKNGPSQGTNGYEDFLKLIGRRTRRLLMLTATPFQLRPSEMLELLRAGAELKPASSQRDSADRAADYEAQRGALGGPIEDAREASARFSRAWTEMGQVADGRELETLWASPPFQSARQQLADPAAARAAEDAIADAVEPVDPALRKVCREALRLYLANQVLSGAMGRFIIRHRRQTDHRLFRVGAEYTAETAHVAARADRHVLHAANGLDVRGPGELPHYLLMRCVSEMKWNEKRSGRSSLGSELTGCYSTLLASSDGKKISARLESSPRGAVYLNLLRKMVTADQDREHPKLKTIVDGVAEAWKRGEKTLLFCMRINTAERLRDLIDERLRQELEVRRRTCLGGETALRNLKKRLTARESDLAAIALDRVLWSYRQVDGGDGAPTPDDLQVHDEDLDVLAHQALRFGGTLDEKRLDRVFLFRAIEHAIARRLVARAGWTPGWQRVLRDVSHADWVSHPYGCQLDDGAPENVEHVSFDERGAGTIYEVAAESPSRDAVQRLAADLRERRARRGLSAVDAYSNHPSLWFGEAIGEAPGKTVRELHAHLWAMTPHSSWESWSTRRLALQAVRRAVLRESVLVRMLPDRTELDEATWGALLVRAFFTPFAGQAESMAARAAIFLEDLRSASGSFFEPGTQRAAYLEATRLRDEQLVALVVGGGDKTTRERIFTGFNTPLLPEVLVCTSVGQEGIDLHRHCRHVVHYDLAWNPAVLEQRTGRVDRIGSKTFRERQEAPTANFFLEVAVPFLAGTYDERMFEELRMRAQTFEVLTGGDVAVDTAEGNDDEDGAEGKSIGQRLPTLPSNMLEDLRVKLHVWNG